jgi:hypothetical protein
MQEVANVLSLWITFEADKLLHFMKKQLTLATTSFWVLVLLLSSFGLRAQITHQVTLNSLQADLLVADAGPDWDTTFFAPFLMGGTPTASGGTPPYQYLWTPATDLDSDTIANPTVQNLQGGSQIYNLLITDARNCTAVDSILVRLRFIGTEDWQLTGFEVYPNPATQFLIVKIPNGKGLLQLTDLNGRVIEAVQVRDTDIQLSVSSLSKGTYYLRYEFQNQVSNQKITLQ